MREKTGIELRDSPGFLTPKQVAAHAAYKSPVSILRAFRRGELRGHKLNSRTVRFDPRDVARWLKATRSKYQKPTSPFPQLESVSYAAGTKKQDVFAIEAEAVGRGNK